jgi:predicted transposase YbfD/YdcC
MPALLRELKAAYGRTRLFDLVTTDAGNTSLAVACLIVALGWNYFAQIKSVQGAIFEEAERALGNRPDEDADASYVDTQNGQIISYHLWRYDLGEDGRLDWTHARRLVRVQRTAEDPKTGEISVGNRYYVTSKSPNALAARSALKISRAHWRCENCTHWTADAEFQEDRRRLAWSRHPLGVLIVSALRMMAPAILSVARLLTRIEYSVERPTWAQVAGHFLLELCDSILETEAFDNV